MFNFFKVFYYFSVYKKYIGNRLILIFVLSGLAAFMEGFGISMLLPLIELTEFGTGDLQSSGDNSRFFLILTNVLSFLNIQNSLVGVLALIGGVFFLKGIILFLSDAYQNYLKAQLLYEIKTKFYDLCTHMSYDYYCNHNTGHFINILTFQVDKFVSSFDGYKRFVTSFITTAAYLITASIIAWKFAAMAFFSGIILLYLFKYVNNYVRNISRKAVTEQGDLNNLLVQVIQSLKYLSSTNQLEFLRAEVRNSIGKLSTYVRNQGISRSFSSSLIDPVSIAFIIVIIIIQISVFGEPLTPILVALVLFNRAIASILQIQIGWQGTMNSIGSLEIIEEEFQKLSDNTEVSGRIELAPFADNIYFDSVSFCYESEKHKALDSISMKIPANSTIAFVGESGAGKSTLVDMLTLLLKPQSGAIQIDGVSFQDINLKSWRKQIGYVSQETVVFNDTIANNISLWRDDSINNNSVQDRIKDAAAKAYALKFIQNLPDQFNTIAGDRGIKLSGGQRQRLFLAREIYKEPKLLILDEATSALDSESERYIQESIDNLKGQTTIVIIAHRLSTIKNADYIYVLKNGRIIEHGDYSELTHLEESLFSKMIKLQSL